MRKYIWRIAGALLVLAVIVAAAPVLLPPGSGVGDGETPGAGGIPGLISLARPAFAAGTAGVNFLEEQAGISAFTNVGREIDLVRARGAFRTIEREGDGYIIGSVGVPGLAEDYDVHVFVHRDGWIVAFYGREHPVARIIDLADLGSTRLETVLMQVGTAAGVGITQVKHFDFRYPEADRMMIIFDRDSFNLKIPGTFTVFERSFIVRAWARVLNFVANPTFYIDESRVWTTRLSPHTQRIGIGTITPARLRPDRFHTVNLRSGAVRRDRANIDGAIVLVYREE